MRHKLLYMLLAAEAVILVLLRACGFAFSSIISFPFVQIGQGLRALSLSGAAGNAAAVALYVCICLLPLLYLLLRRIRRRAGAEDALLALLSALLFWTLYLLVNPEKLGSHLGAPMFAGMGQQFVSGTLWSVLIGYLVMRFLRTFTSHGTGMLLQYLERLLGVLCAVLVYGIFGTELDGLLAAFRELAEKNTGVSALGVSYVFLAVQYLMAILPYGLDLAIILFGLRLTDALKIDVYSAEASAAAWKLGRICRLSVAVVLLTQIAVNVAQLLLGGAVRSSGYTVQIPLLSIVFVLAVLLMANYFADSRRLKEDNDSFI